ncbi:hypothetical protein [Clostridium sp. 'White wine YQ']|uniref:hypothetical protein n=1 Tax=Clostridium sp. 'White wine YQ' TaxID=3027474 RepID=UPI0023656D48|nr:hypothetical protein [Clostridium sp. 'White wine YQ']MDD7794317.1 hypothetical protein [Clostridium sp. 'White wine YQ']
MYSFFSFVFQALLAISIPLIIGMLISRIAGLIRSKIFRFTDIFKYILKSMKKHNLKS